MSDLKHQTVSELSVSKVECQNYINNLKSKLSGQQSRLEWINKYLFEKTPVEMSIKQIESKLGHKVILK